MPAHTAPDTAARIERSFGVTARDNTVRRLSPETRRLAARILAGDYGSRMAPASFALTADEQAIPDPELRAATAVKRIAQQAPLRIVPEERLAGAAPLLEAAHHIKPINGTPGTSHTTIGLKRAVYEGLDAYRQRIHSRLNRGKLAAQQIQFLQAMTICLDAMMIWHKRLMDELTRLEAESSGTQRDQYRQVKQALARVPAQPPQSFREALQSLWVLWEFQRLCGNWSGIGRIDAILGPYLEKDLRCAHITRSEARELLAHFWIKGAEWTGAPTPHRGSSGDAQFYQNVILGGVDEDGEPLENTVTELVLDVVEELHISDFPIAVRVSSRTPAWLWRRIAEIQRRGGGIVSIYNEDVVIEALTRFGYDLREARTFTNDGCWEVILPGKTAFRYRPFDILPCVQTAIGLTEDDPDEPVCDTFEQFYTRFHGAMQRRLEQVWGECAQSFTAGTPSPLLSLFVEDCIERAKPYHQRGARYSVCSPHAGGMPDAANSLFAVKTLVYDEKRLGLSELRSVLQHNWKGHERLRQTLKRDLVLYGNDDPAADAMLTRVYGDYTDLCRQQPSCNGVLMPAGISTFGREIAFREGRTAQPFGTLADEILASNLSPTPGTDRQGPTAVVRSFCKADFADLPCGTPLDLKIHPGSLKGETGVAALVSLLRTFVDLGGFYLQVDAVDADTLREAQKHPERYPNLAVRVSGWSARFTTLDPVWQAMIIQRTEQTLGG